MKNKIVSTLLVLCMMASLLSMSSCNMLDMSSESDYAYDAEKVQASIDKLTESGYRITLRYLTVESEVGSQPQMQSAGFTIAADGDLWYCEQIEDGVKTTTIMDFSNDTEFVSYTKNDGDDKWTKSVTSYEYMGDKESVKSIYMNTYLAIFTGYGMVGLGLKDKGSVTVAGRACTKYEASISAFGASYSNEYYIDNETGLCLKNVIAVGASTEGSASTSYECTLFEVGYRITLPSEGECVTENDGSGSNSGSTGDQGGNTGSTPEFDIGAIMGGNGTTDIIYGQFDETTKQQLIAEAKKNGVNISFGVDGSMTVVDPVSGETITQKPDGTWVIKGETGSEGQFGGNWPDNEFTRLLPKPDFPLLAANTTEDDFSVAFQNVTVEQIRDYVEKIKAKGFTVNAEITDQEVMGIVAYSYQAENADGYAVTVTFTGGTSGVVIEKP